MAFQQNKMKFLLICCINDSKLQPHLPKGRFFIFFYFFLLGYGNADILQSLLLGAPVECVLLKSSLHPSAHVAKAADKTQHRCPTSFTGHHRMQGEKHRTISRDQDITDQPQHIHTRRHSKAASDIEPLVISQ